MIRRLLLDLEVLKDPGGISNGPGRSICFSNISNMQNPLDKLQLPSPPFFGYSKLCSRPISDFEIKQNMPNAMFATDCVPKLKRRRQRRRRMQRPRTIPSTCCPSGWTDSSIGQCEHCPVSSFPNSCTLLEDSAKLI